MNRVKRIIERYTSGPSSDVYSSFLTNGVSHIYTQHAGVTSAPYKSSLPLNGYSGSINIGCENPYKVAMWLKRGFVTTNQNVTDIRIIQNKTDSTYPWTRVWDRDLNESCGGKTVFFYMAKNREGVECVKDAGINIGRNSRPIPTCHSGYICPPESLAPSADNNTDLYLRLCVKYHN